MRVPRAAWQQAELPFSSAFPQLFVHEGARQLLEKRLGALVSERVVLSVTDNRRTMITSQRRTGVLRVRLHHMFLDADPFTLRALARYIKRGERAASSIVGRYIDSNQQRIRPALRRSITLRTDGDHHDLRSVFDLLNGSYFGGLVDAQITWGRQAPPRKRRRRRSIKLGTYCAEEKLIRIHPALDQVWVPRYFLEYIVFHEMLHHVTPMPMQNGRRQFHTRDFRERERAFAHYDRAIRWEKRFVHRLLAS